MVEKFSGDTTSLSDMLKKVTTDIQEEVKTNGGRMPLQSSEEPTSPMLNYSERAALYFEKQGEDVLRMATDYNEACKAFGKAIRDAAKEHEEEGKKVMERIQKAADNHRKVEAEFNGKDKPW